MAAATSAGKLMSMLGWHSGRESAGKAQVETYLLPSLPNMLITSSKDFRKMCPNQRYKYCRALQVGSSVSALPQADCSFAMSRGHESNFGAERVL